MTLLEKMRKAVRHPEKVPSYLRRRAAEGTSVVDDVRRWFATRTALRGKTSQKFHLDALRKGDSWLLVVLDACRYAEFEDLAPLVFEGSIEALASEGRDTFEYVRTCWPDYYPDVTYVSGAVPVNSDHIEFDDDHLQSLYDGYRPVDHVPNIVDAWADCWNEGLGTTPSWQLTPEATTYLDRPRLVVHYFQPHAPYVGVERALGHTDNEHAKPRRGKPVDAPLWRRIKRGDIDDARLAELYQSNLELVLAETAKLVERAEHDRIVVAADHGEVLGEYGTYAHPRVEHPHIRVVPWMEIDSVREGWRNVIHTPTETGEYGNRDAERNVRARLSEFGYV